MNRDGTELRVEWNDDRSNVTLSLRHCGFRLSESEAADVAHLLRTGGEDTNTLTSSYRVSRVANGFRITALRIAWIDLSHLEARRLIALLEET